jgi:glycoprotein endo-alpha-1,2-mannosidase
MVGNSYFLCFLYFRRFGRGGQYYEKMWTLAVDIDPDFVRLESLLLVYCSHFLRYSITSFNEWGEGTQIEPAMAFAVANRTYLPYSNEKGENDDYLYLNITSTFSKKFQEKNTEIKKERDEM